MSAKVIAFSLPIILVWGLVLFPIIQIVVETVASTRREVCAMPSRCLILYRLASNACFVVFLFLFSLYCMYVSRLSYCI